MAMKKYIIGIAVAAIFVAYSAALRHQHSGPVIAPASLNQNNSNSSAAAPSTSNSNSTTVSYKDGTYNGSVADAYYGSVQVSATIQNGLISDVNFLQSPNDNPNSIYVNQQAMPYLKQEAIKAQSANVNIITGATLTSQAFIQSLTSALSQALKS